MPAGAGITLGKGWIGEIVYSEGKPVTAITRESDGAKLQINGVRHD